MQGGQIVHRLVNNGGGALRLSVDGTRHRTDIMNMHRDLVGSGSLLFGG